MPWRLAPVGGVGSFENFSEEITGALELGKTYF